MTITNDCVELCHVCGKPAINGPGERQLNYCDICDEPVCTDDAEYDYDLVGDPPYYRCTQWVHLDRSKCQEVQP